MGQQQQNTAGNDDADDLAGAGATAPLPVVMPAGVGVAPPATNGAHLEMPAGARPGAAPAAGHGPSAADGHPPTAADGLVHILTRQWPVLATATAVAVLLAVVYLLLAPKTYTASAKLRVSPVDPQVMAGTAAGGGGEVPEDYLDTECVVIKSDAVLALALDKVGRTRTLMAAARPLDALQAGIDATVAKKGKAIEVSFDSRYPRDAEQIVAAVVEAYRTYNANYWAHQADTFRSALQGGSTSQRARLTEDLDRLRIMQETNGSAMDANPENSPAHQAVVSLRDAKYKADQDAINARTVYTEAVQSIAGDPAKVAAVERAVRDAPFMADPESHLKTVQNELQVQQARLTDARNQYMAGHPVVLTIQARINQLTVDAVVAAKQWQDVAELHQQALARSLSDAQRVELEAVQNQVEYARLSGEVSRITAEENAVDTRVRAIESSKGAGAVNISVLDDPHVDWVNVKPGRAKTLAVATLLGLLAGAGLACLRDWSDDRFRTMPAIRAAAGAPVLGAIPAIPSSVAASAADRGQVVHFDPFGDASESYRTLRTALQFGLPPRTKTLLVTSPMAGDGKSTLVSNLAIALAQANKRVLVVDADLRAPVQHRLFGLSDRTGLASVLDGSDTLDGAVRHTGIEGLDVLPAGPIPSNPAELLNTPDFADHLNDLADRYDLVLIDSPPVTAVTDARILAASADASLLVVRLGSSTRRQTEAARDGLRGVGARLIGVAVNGVSRRGSLASATGYYARPEMAPAKTPVNLSVAAPPHTPEFLAGGRLGHDPLSDAVRTAPPASRR